LQIVADCAVFSGDWRRVFGRAFAAAHSRAGCAETSVAFEENARRLSPDFAAGSSQAFAQLALNWRARGKAGFMGDRRN
jgi:hypothetical protein